MICLESNKIIIQDEKDFSNFPKIFTSQTRLSDRILNSVEAIKISGSDINTFDFLETMPNLTMIYFLASRSDKWHTLKVTHKVISLGLHNLKHGKKYLFDTSFLINLPNIEYLYVNMLGVNNIAELTDLYHLHTVIGCFRNENDIKLPHDFTSFKSIKNLKIFDGYCATDSHRTPAESFIPILENTTLTSFKYTQFFGTEDKKTLKLINTYNPNIINTTLSDAQLLEIRGQCFAS